MRKKDTNQIRLDSMKILKKLTIALVLTTVALQIFAQPIPPATPSGNPIPIGNTLIPIILLTLGFGVFNLLKQNRKIEI